MTAQASIYVALFATFAASGVLVAVLLREVLFARHDARLTALPRREPAERAPARALARDWAALRRQDDFRQAA